MRASKLIHLPGNFQKLPDFQIFVYYNCLIIINLYSNWHEWNLAINLTNIYRPIEYGGLYTRSFVLNKTFWIYPSIPLQKKSRNKWLQSLTFWWELFNLYSQITIQINEGTYDFKMHCISEISLSMMSSQNVYKFFRCSFLWLKYSRCLFNKYILISSDG